MSAIQLIPGTDFQTLINKRGLDLIARSWDWGSFPGLLPVVEATEDLLAIPGQLFDINGTYCTYVGIIEAGDPQKSPTLNRYQFKTKLPYSPCNRVRRRH